MTPAVGAMSLFIALAAVAGCAVLLWLGFRGRRVGDEPRCRKCSYNLTGATSPACPECGGIIDERGVVFGTRRRRPVIIAFALLLGVSAAIFGGLDGYRRLQALNKYRYYPVAWLMTASREGDLKALAELDARLRAGQLTASQCEGIVSDALQTQASSSGNAGVQAWVNMLDLLEQQAKLSETQRQQYFDQMRVYTLVVRPRVLRGDPVPLEVQFVASGPNIQVDPNSQGRWQQIALLDVTIDETGEANEDSGPAADHHLRRSCASRPNGVGDTGQCEMRPALSDLAPGKYRATCAFEDRVFPYGVDRPTVDVAPLHTRKLERSVEFEVLPANDPDTVELVKDPEMAEPIRVSLRMGTLDVQPSHYPDQVPDVYLTIQATPYSNLRQLPIDLAFDVYIRTEAGEWKLGQTVLRRSPFYGTHVHGAIPLANVDKADVILRTNPAVARTTVDINRIWDGELIFKDVVVVQPSDPMP